MNFTDAERSSIVNALNVASQQYIDDAQVCLGSADDNYHPDGRASHERLAEQFTRQAAEARRLAVRFEEEA